jgi:hypothetical protein
LKAIKYETIKLNASREFYGRAGGNGQTIGFAGTDSAAFWALAEQIGAERPRKVQDICKEWIDKGCELINRWDIRCVKKLIELFPSCVPAYCHKLPIQLDDSGEEWMVVFGSA